jgi:hypothetical protein
MSKLTLIAPLQEQKICITCGFCCDGTLFPHAHLNPGERGNLPEEIERASFSEDGKDYFRLPCHYFAEKCIIYDRKRADVCGSYRCLLLKDFAEGKISVDDALEVVQGATRIRREIIEEYCRFSGKSGDINFREILFDLGRISKSTSETEPVGAYNDLLLARCNILEVLIIKHFRSAEEFEKMIMK